ncbi:MAG: Hsp20/alpha crystallin family protein [Anaerolineae bacterium]|nr:Hsp20/alpha crystallin family protein [Anaerolineae bacterium]
MSRNDDNELTDDVRQADKPSDYAINDLMLTVRWLTTRQQKTWRPATDVYETDESVIVKVEVAGVSERDFTISLSNRNLIITGIRRDCDPKLAYQQLEIPYGQFRTQVFLPYAVEQEEINASYKDGFLTVLLPKIKVKKIQIKQASASTSQNVE